jgi:hypothetical protein
MKTITKLQMIPSNFNKRKFLQLFFPCGRNSNNSGRSIFSSPLPVGSSMLACIKDLSFFGILSPSQNFWFLFFKFFPLPYILSPFVGNDVRK